MICTMHWETPKNCPENILSSVGWGGGGQFSPFQANTELHLSHLPQKQVKMQAG